MVSKKQNNEINMVEYDCIGEFNNNEILKYYILKDIEEGNNIDSYQKSNFKEIIQNTNLNDLENKIISNYKLQDLMEIIIFKMNEIKNQTSNNYYFNFTINGKINKDLPKFIIKGKLKINEIEDLTIDYIFNIEENKKAYLICKLNISEYKQQKEFTLEISDISNNNNFIFFEDLDKIT